MDKVRVFVGLDYHSKSVQVCVMDVAGRVLANRSCGNSVLELGNAIGAGRTVQRAACSAASARWGRRVGRASRSPVRCCWRTAPPSNDHASCRNSSAAPRRGASSQQRQQAWSSDNAATAAAAGAIADPPPR